MVAADAVSSNAKPDPASDDLIHFDDGAPASNLGCSMVEIGQSAPSAEPDVDNCSNQQLYDFLATRRNELDASQGASDSELFRVLSLAKVFQAARRLGLALRSEYSAEFVTRERTLALLDELIARLRARGIPAAAFSNLDLNNIADRSRDQSRSLFNSVSAGDADHGGPHTKGRVTIVPDFISSLTSLLQDAYQSAVQVQRSYCDAFYVAEDANPGVRLFRPDPKAEESHVFQALVQHSMRCRALAEQFAAALEEAYRDCHRQRIDLSWADSILSKATAAFEALSGWGPCDWFYALRGSYRQTSWELEIRKALDVFFRDVAAAVSELDKLGIVLSVGETAAPSPATANGDSNPLTMRVSPGANGGNGRVLEKPVTSAAVTIAAASRSDIPDNGIPPTPVSPHVLTDPRLAALHRLREEFEFESRRCRRLHHLVFQPLSGQVQLPPHLAGHIEHYGPDCQSNHSWNYTPSGWEISFLYGEGQDIVTFEALAERAYLALPIQQGPPDLDARDRADTWLFVVHEILRRHRRQLLAHDRVLRLYSTENSHHTYTFHGEQEKQIEEEPERWEGMLRYRITNLADNPFRASAVAIDAIHDFALLEELSPTFVRCAARTTMQNLPTERTPRPCAPRGRNERLIIDLDSGTAFLDGEQFIGIDTDALRALKAVADASRPTSMENLGQKIKGCNHRKTFGRWLEKLPPQLRSLVQGKPGSGVELILPSLS